MRRLVVFTLSRHCLPPFFELMPLLHSLGNLPTMAYSQWPMAVFTEWQVPRLKYWYETFCVGYSTTTNDVTAFTWGDVISAYEHDWKLYSDVFPAGTKYVAIKHISDDAYYLYVDDFSFQPVFTKTIVGVGEENWDGGKGGYYLIASPLAAAVDPTTVSMITDSLGNTATTSTGTYDLYSFDQAQELEWQNYRTSNFNLENGQGYLYASKGGTPLTFIGEPYDGTGVVTLEKVDEAVGPGWNLVGNPFGKDAYITKPFYTLENSDTYTLNTAGTAIHPMQGLFVVAGSDGEELTFSTEAPVFNNGKLSMNVSKVGTHGVSTGSTTSNVVDRAIISFTEGQQQPKLQFRNGSTKVYLPKDGKEYAIVSTEAMAPCPSTSRLRTTAPTPSASPPRK